MKTLFSLLIVVFTFLGILDAGYVSWTQYSGVVPDCRPPFACETVLKSSWSKIGPIPLSGLGIVFYSSFFLISAAAVLEVKSIKVGAYSVALPAVVFLWGIVGGAFSTYLLFIMGVVLKAWCLYCLLSALNCAIVFLISSGLWKNAHSPKLLGKDADALHI